MFIKFVLKQIILKLYNYLPYTNVCFCYFKVPLVTLTEQYLTTGKYINNNKAAQQSLANS